MTARAGAEAIRINRGSASIVAGTADESGAMRKKVDQLGDGVLDNHEKVVTLDQVRPLAPSRIPSSVWACRGRGRDGDPPEGAPVAVQGLSPCIHRSSPARARESKQYCITPYTVSLGRSERVYLPRATPRVPACTLLLIRSQNEYVMENQIS